MSDDDADLEDEPDVDGPDLSDEDLVEIDPEVAAAAVDDAADEEDDPEPAESDDVDESGDSGQETASVDVGEQFGDVSIGNTYCQALGLGASLARERRGSGIDGADRNDLADEYADMARQLDLDRLVDKWVAENTGADELTPGQAIVLSTSVFAMMVLMDDPALAEGLAGEVGA